MGRSRKPLCGQPYRGFESLSLRQLTSCFHRDFGFSRPRSNFLRSVRGLRRPQEGTSSRETGVVPLLGEALRQSLLRRFRWYDCVFDPGGRSGNSSPQRDTPHQCLARGSDVLAARLSLGDPKHLHLLRPGGRKRVAQRKALGTELGRLPAAEDGLDDVGREKAEPEDSGK